MVSAAEERITGAEGVVWDLSGLYTGIDDPTINADMQKLQAMATDFAGQFKGRVAALDAEEIREAMETLESIYDLQGRLGSFASLVYTVDTTDPKNGALYQRITELGAAINQKLVFFDLEWNDASTELVERLLADPVLEKYHHHLESERRYKPYQLSEAEEQILVRKSVTGRSAWVRFFTQLMAAMRYDYEGEKLTETKVLSKLHDPNREVRRKAADSVTAGLREREMELTFIFNVLAADKADDDNLREYPEWITPRNLSNKAPDQVVEALISTVTSRYDIVARHYELKRKLLGLDELADYDRYAPLPLEEGDNHYSWDEARDIVLNAFERFHPRIADTARLFFDNHWIHAAQLPNKRSGAYASPVTPSANPFVFLNYDGKARDVSTLAHELGHGIHMRLSGQANGLFALYTPLTTAEMASVFGEMLVFSDLMAREDDPEARLAMLAGKVEDTFATVFRQTAMNRFEHGMHTARREEGELTTERMSEIWMDTQQAMFGDSVNLRDEYGIWWSYIPHFLRTPGYVYAYAFGELLVLALYNLYQEQGDSFAPKYIEVLEAGNADYPDRILAKAGIDLNDPEFWQHGLDAIEALVAQEEELARELYPEKFA